MTTAPQEAENTLPVYGWHQAPPGMATRAQLRKLGLRPNGQDVAAEIRWRSRKARGRGGWRTAWLYPIAGAAPVKPMTEGRHRALAAAMRARRTCPACRRDAGYVIPTSLGACVPCADQH